MQRFFIDYIATYSFLHFHWFILVFIGIVLLEAIIYYLYWKKPIFSLIVSLIANISSSLVAIPFLIVLPSMTPSWLIIIEFGEIIASLGKTKLFVYWTGESSLSLSSLSILFIITFFSILFFVFTLVISIIIEGFIANQLKEKKENDFKIIIIANSITYCCILIILFLMGGIFGLVNQNSQLNAETFYGEWLFVSLDDYFIYSELFGFFWQISFLISFIVILAYLANRIVKIINLPSENA